MTSINHFNEDHYSTHAHYLANEINLNEINLKNFLTAPTPEKKVSQSAPAKPVQKAYAINPTSIVINQMINSLK